MVLTKPLDGNEYQQYFLEGKGIGLTVLPPSSADCFELCEFEPLGTLRASSGNYRGIFMFYLMGVIVQIKG